MEWNKFYVGNHIAPWASCFWELAIEGGESLAISSGVSLGAIESSFLAALGAVTPIVVAVVVVAAIAYTSNTNIEKEFQGVPV